MRGGIPSAWRNTIHLAFNTGCTCTYSVHHPPVATNYSPTAIKSAKQNKLVVVHNRDITKPARGCHCRRRHAEGIGHPSASDATPGTTTGSTGGIVPLPIAHRTRRFLNTRPSLGLDVKAPQIVQPRRAVVAAKQVDPRRIADDDAVVLATSRLFVGQDFDLLPFVGVEPVRVEVVQTTCATSVSLSIFEDA